MALHIEDPEVDQLAERLAAISKISKTDAVRHALLRELEREWAVRSLVEKGVDFCRALRARGNRAQSLPADTAFFDSLYEKE